MKSCQKTINEATAMLHYLQVTFTYFSFVSMFSSEKKLIFTCSGNEMMLLSSKTDIPKPLKL